MSEMAPNIQTAKSFPPTVMTPEYSRMEGDRGAINFGAAGAAINGMRRAFLQRRIDRLDADIGEHYVEADYVGRVRQQIGINMGEQYDAHGTLVQPHTESQPIDFGHHVPSANPLKGLAESSTNIYRLRREATARRAGGPDVNLEGTKLADKTGGKTVIEGVDGKPITRQVDPPTKWARKVERDMARRLRVHTDTAREQAVQEGKLGSHRRSALRTRAQRISGWVEDRLDPAVSPFEATENRSQRRAESVHVPTRKVTKGSARINDLRGGTLTSLEKAAAERAAKAQVKQAKRARLQAKQARI